MAGSIPCHLIVRDAAVIKSHTMAESFIAAAVGTRFLINMTVFVDFIIPVACCICSFLDLYPCQKSKQNPQSLGSNCHCQPLNRVISLSHHCMEKDGKQSVQTQKTSNYIHFMPYFRNRTIYWHCGTNYCSDDVNLKKGFSFKSERSLFKSALIFNSNYTGERKLLPKLIQSFRSSSNRQSERKVNFFSFLSIASRRTLKAV